MPAKTLTDAFVRTRKTAATGSAVKRVRLPISTRSTVASRWCWWCPTGGAKTFRALTYVNGKPVSRKLGTYPQLSLAEAKKQARAHSDNPQEFHARRPRSARSRRWRRTGSSATSRSRV